MPRLSGRCRWRGHDRWTAHGAGITCRPGSHRDASDGDAREERQLQLPAIATEPAAAGIDARQSSGCQGERGRAGHCLPRRQGHHQPFTQSYDDLLREGHQVAALPFQLVEDLDAREGVTFGERVHESLDGGLRGETQEVAHEARIDDRVGGGQHLVQQRLGVAHATCGEAGDEVEGVGDPRPDPRTRGCAPACPRSRRWTGAGT